MDAPPNITELNELFAPNVADGLGAEVIAELESMIRLFSVTPQELFFKWESYSFTMNLDGAVIDFKTARDLKKFIQTNVEKESSRARAKEAAAGRLVAPDAHHRTPMVSRVGMAGDVYGMLDDLSPAVTTLKRKAVFETPRAKTPRSTAAGSPRKASDMTPIPMRPFSFADRPNRSRITDSFNPASLPEPTPPGPADRPATKQRVKLRAFTDLSKFGYKTMSMKLSEIADILDDRIDLFAALVQEHYQLEDSAFGNPATQNPAEIVVVGRIVADNPSGETTKLTASSVMLETSRLVGAGLRVPLEISGLQGRFDFFPGQIVAFWGSNPSGHTFSVRQELKMPALLSASSLPSEITTHNNAMAAAHPSSSPSSTPSLTPSGQSKPLNIIVANGPYTLESCLDFSAFTEVLDVAHSSQADCLILSGPFIDIDHPLIRTGDFDFPVSYPINPDTANLTDLFKCYISGPLTQLSQALPSLSIILVPSVRDAIAKHICWPQDRLVKRELGLPKQVTVVTNPITLGLNETVVGISSLDALDSFRRTGCVGPGMKDHPFARLARYMIDQRHFYPVFPPPTGFGTKSAISPPGQDGDSGVEIDFQPVGPMVDTTYLKLGEWTNIKPDILICPSQIPAFAMVVDHVLVINPGFISKPKSSGTYARITLPPYDLSEDEKQNPEEPITHRVYDRARVDITRI